MEQKERNSNEVESNISSTLRDAGEHTLDPPPLPPSAPVDTLDRQLTAVVHADSDAGVVKDLQFMMMQSSMNVCIYGCQGQKCIVCLKPSASAEI